MEQLEVAAVRLRRPGREADGAVNEMTAQPTRVRKDGIATSRWLAGIIPPVSLVGFRQVNGETLVVILGVLLQAQVDLADIGKASGLSGFLAGAGKDGEQNCCQDRNYRDHYQQFNQREANTKANLKVASPNRLEFVPFQHPTSLLALLLLGWNFRSLF
jgi:hypothetical protein